jgi:hypothetical protein
MNKIIKVLQYIYTIHIYESEELISYEYISDIIIKNNNSVILYKTKDLNEDNKKNLYMMGIIQNEDINSNKLDDGIICITLDKTDSNGTAIVSILKDDENICEEYIRKSMIKYNKCEECLEEKQHVKLSQENGRCICNDCFLRL